MLTHTGYRSDCTSPKPVGRRVSILARRRRNHEETDQCNYDKKRASCVTLVDGTHSSKRKRYHLFVGKRRDGRDSPFTSTTNLCKAGENFERVALGQARLSPERHGRYVDTRSVIIARSRPVVLSALYTTILRDSGYPNNAFDTYTWLWFSLACQNFCPCPNTLAVRSPNLLQTNSS